MKTILQGRSSIRRWKPQWQPHKPARRGAPPLPRHEARPLPPVLRTAAIGLVFLLADIALAGGVFLPAGMPMPASQMAPTSAGEARRGRFVRIAHNELSRARAEVGNFGQSRLLFNMSGHLEFDVAIERTTRTLDGYTLSGQIDGGKGGFVTLAVHPGAVAGSIWTWDGHYEVVPVGGGVHSVRRVIDDPVECEVAQAQPGRLPTPVPTNDMNGEDAVVDILVFWTPNRERRSGGEAAVRAEIDLRVAYTNDALERSGALLSLHLVGAERLDIEETPGELWRYYDVMRGEYATQRAQALGADLVNTRTDGSYGSASGSLSISSGGLQHFAHEIGHSLTLAHDRANSSAILRSYDGGYSSRDAANGWVRCSNTIMAVVGVCGDLPITTVPYYASPNRYHPLTGQPLGVSRLSEIRGWDGPADAVLAVNRRRHFLSNLRARPSGQ